MNKIKRKGLTFLLSLTMMFYVTSCDLFDLDINKDPNNPTQASIELLLTNAQYGLASTFAGGLNDMAQGFMAINTSTDDFNMTNATWNGTWNALYDGPLMDLERLIRAVEAQDNPHYLGIAQVLKAYYFSLMVDLWGDVPYSEAFKGDEGILEPAYDDDEEIYANLLTMVDDAISNLEETSAVDVEGDLMYGGSVSKWIKAAHSLKLRLLIQTRRVNPNAAADIQAVINDNAYIKSAADDFQFKFAKLQNPDNRHPMYQAGYSGGEAAYNYFGHQIMAEMLANRDPRTPFYFKRQTEDILDPADPTDKQTTPCSQRDDCVYSYFVASPVVTNMVFGVDPGDLSDDERAYLAGFFGRDRSDPSGVPNDNPIRTTVGAYPAAGLFDDVAEAGGENQGSGDGIFPMITSWMVKFYLAEAKITLGVTIPGNPTEADLLDGALTEQFEKVFVVGTAADPDANPNVDEWTDPDDGYDWPITYTDVDTYIANEVGNYPILGNQDQRMQYLLKQAWFANFGNGFEMYNAFRRTGFPNDIQAPLQIPRQFALRLPYAQDELNLNSKTPTVVYDDPTDAVFWDVLKFQFN